MIDTAVSHARANYDQYLEQFLAYLRIPSVSALPEHKADVRAAAEWLAADNGADLVAVDVDIAGADPFRDMLDPVVDPGLQPTPRDKARAARHRLAACPPAARRS